MQYFNFAAAISARTIVLAAVLGAASPAAQASAPALAPATLQSGVSVQGFGRSYDGRQVTVLISRAVHLAEALDGRSGQHWSFVLQTCDNRPVTLVTASLQDGGHKPVSGSFRTATLGTAPPIVFVEEVEVFARMLLTRARQQTS